MMNGKILGNRYEILEEIGCGGMANVYKAHCKLLNRPVAVKVLKKELGEDSEYINRFNIEAQAAASLVHPNIVSIFDFGSEDDSRYIVMELIEGITLKQFINENAPLDIKDALNIAYQICDALSVAHDHKIIHRDIKPQNIMITPDLRVKVTDFGIARASGGSTMTADNSIIGSVHYISPEQARGAVLDGRTDLYSLGIVLYEMLTGKVPFECDSPVAVAMKHIEETPASPSEYNSNVNYSVEQMVMKAISKNIDDRYQTATDFKNDIQKLIDNPEALIVFGKNSPLTTVDDDATRKIPVVNVEKEPVNKKAESKDVSVINNQSDKQSNKKLLIVSIITSLLIVGALSTYISYLLFPDAPLFAAFSSDKEMVPDLYGMTFEEARETANELGFEIDVSSKRVSDEMIDEGCVAKQDPKAEKKAKKGSKILVYLSESSEKSMLRDYKLINYNAAVRDLEDFGYIVECEFEFNDDVPENFVIDQDPEGNTELQKGSKVTLIVSKGPEETTVTVPKFVGKTLDEAQTILLQEGLVMGEVTYEESVVEEGLIVKQSISGGESVNKNTEISFVVSSGGKTEEDPEEDPEDQNNNQPDDQQNNQSGDQPNNQPDDQPNNQPDNRPSVQPPENKPEQNNPPKDEPVKKSLTYSYEQGSKATSIRVVEGGTTIYEGMAEPEKGGFSMSVEGTGQKSYEIYLDGVLVDTKVVVFN